MGVEVGEFSFLLQNTKSPVHAEVEYIALCAAHSTLKQYKWGAAHVYIVYSTDAQYSAGMSLLRQSIYSRADLMHIVQ